MKVTLETDYQIDPLTQEARTPPDAEWVAEARVMGASERTYNYLLRRVEYPMERGYRMEPFKLPPWIHVVITEEGDSKWLTVHSRIHVNKEVRMQPSFSNKFSDWEILKDLSGKISQAFL